MFFTIYSDLCHKIGRSPSWVAQQLGINKSTVTYWKNNRDAKPSNEVICKIADYFNVTLDYLSGVQEPVQSGERDIRYAAYKETEGLDDEEIKDVINFIRYKKSIK